jgi:large subunit ribosomal protein L25
MSYLRRAFTTASRQLNAAQPSTSALPQSTVPADQLPPVIFNLISRHLASQSNTSSNQAVYVPNPFISKQAPIKNLASGSPSSKSVKHTCFERIISRRREKQLLASYANSSLPPSQLNQSSLAVEWTDGRIVNWSGRIPKTVEKDSLYSGRRFMFKGHKHQREKIERKKDTKERLQGMEKRIREWREVSLIHA